MGTKARLYLGILLLLFFLSYLMLFVTSPEVERSLTAEDHLYENQQAVCDLLASALFLVTFLKDHSGNDFHILRTRKNVFFLLLAVVFFFGFGEEISWGQRIFGWRTPASLAQINVQGETNIHNIEVFAAEDAQGNRKSFWAAMLDINRVFSMFWFSYCFVIPVLDKFLVRFSRWIRRLNLPIVPLWMGVLFPLNYLVEKIIQRFFTNSLWTTQTEVKETVFAFLFFALSLWFLTELRERPERNAAPCEL